MARHLPTDLASPIRSPQAVKIGLLQKWSKWVLPIWALLFLVATGVSIHAQFIDGVRPISLEGSGPGRPMEIYLCLPPGPHEPKSLPCVFIPPSSLGLLGGGFKEKARDEYLPYLQAGFAVVAYELSGGAASNDLKDVVPAIKAFMATDGGVKNGRLAIDYVLQKVPEVDPSQLFACGFSSAGTVTLNLARLDPRIKACCAYAPRTDVQAWPVYQDPHLDDLIPGFEAFKLKDSPVKHVADFHCPVFLFHADDDSHVPLDTTLQFVAQMQAAGKQITFTRVATGDHYGSMFQKGIVDGIEFLKAHGAKP